MTRDQIKRIIGKSKRSIQHLALLSSLAVASALLLPVAAAQKDSEPADAGHEHSTRAAPARPYAEIRVRD
jgi:hypothetical protein